VDFYYFSPVQICVVVSASNLETVCVSLLEVATETGNGPMGNLYGGVEKVSRSVDDEGEVSASEIDEEGASFDGTQECVI